MKMSSSAVMSCTFVIIAALFSLIPAHVSAELHTEQLEPIAEIVETEIKKGHIPGAVVLIGNQEKIIYRKAFGYRALKPKRFPMAADTIFDIASLTKVVATTTAVMQLVESGQLNLEDPVVKYWPEFGANNKEQITVLHTLTHYSGLRPDLNLKPKWLGYETALKKIIDEKPVYQIGTQFIYSDINFVVLGELVHRITGQPFDEYCDKHIFETMGMNDTFFNPAKVLHKRIAPTEYANKRKGIVLCGEVHDQTAYRMGGIAGHAGLFSTADDLSVFAQMLLNGGSIGSSHILSPSIIDKMTAPQSPFDKMPLRGLGWNIDAPLASNRSGLFPMGSYNHKGYTGTAIWIDPISKIYVIVLTNRVHPRGKGNVDHLREEIVSLISEAIGPISPEQVLASRPSLTDDYEIMKNRIQNEKLKIGIDVLVEKKFKPLKGLRIGLITNHSGVNSSGIRTIALLRKARGLKLKAIFSPEHGPNGNEDGKVISTKDPLTGLPVYSLYGDTLKPTQKMLKGIDALVFDIQDAGTRFYTYITTMAYAMEAAAKNGIAFYVLDRPNLINGSLVQGPVMDKDIKSFTGYFPMPIRHGMTVGELARMFNSENKIGAKLHVIEMQGYRRTTWHEETGMAWTNPSPNLHNLTEAVLYPGVGMIEGANVSVGRGTDTPFEIIGAPWINAEELTSYLNDRQIQGIAFEPVDFTPSSGSFKNQLCHGVRIIIADRQTLDPTALGIEIASALYRLYPVDFQIDKTLESIGSHSVLQAVKDARDPYIIVADWQDSLRQFIELRSRYLLY